MMYKNGDGAPARAEGPSILLLELLRVSKARVYLYLLLRKYGSHDHFFLGRVRDSVLHPAMHGN